MSKCILRERLYVPVEYVNDYDLQQFTYAFEVKDRKYDADNIPEGTLSNIIKVQNYKKIKSSTGDLYYGFARGHQQKLKEMFGSLEWEDRTVAPGMSAPLKLLPTTKLKTFEKDGVGQREVVLAWLKQKNGIIRAAPRFGKTVCTVALVTVMKKKTLILTHQEDLLEQFKSEFFNFTNIQDLVVPNKKRRDATGQVIGFFSDYDNPEELDICLLCWQTLSSKYGPERLNKYKDAWGLLVVDECLDPHTKIQVPEGIKKLGELEIGDEVLSPSGVRVTIKNKWETNKPAFLYRLKSGAEIIASENHLFATLDPSREIKAAKYCSNFENWSEGRDDIIQVSPLGSRRLIDIELDNEEKLFIANGIISHNCHKSGGFVYASVLNKINARHRLGLTGTLERVDRREKMIVDILGPVVAEGRVEQVPCGVTVIHTNIRVKYGKDEPLPYLYKRLYRDPNRLDIVLKYLEEDVRDGFFICVGFHRYSTVQLKNFTKVLQDRGFAAEAFFGAVPDRQGVLSRFKSGETVVAVCNVSMLTGINIPRWNAFYRMFPSANIVFKKDDEGNLQISGNDKQEFDRIRTPFEYSPGVVKKFGLIRDFVDTNPFCNGCFKKRLRAYKQQKFLIENIYEREVLDVI